MLIFCLLLFTIVVLATRRSKAGSTSSETKAGAREDTEELITVVLPITTNNDHNK